MRETSDGEGGGDEALLDTEEDAVVLGPVALGCNRPPGENIPGVLFVIKGHAV